MDNKSIYLSTDVHDEGRTSGADFLCCNLQVVIGRNLEKSLAGMKVEFARRARGVIKKAESPLVGTWDIVKRRRCRLRSDIRCRSIDCLPQPDLWSSWCA